MFVIKRVEIDGFWGNLQLNTDLHHGVNIFIGDNGTGNTTFINMLEAALRVDLNLLQSLQFSEIRLLLQNQRRQRNIIIRKISKVPYDELYIKIGAQSFQLPLLPKDIDYRRRYIHQRYTEQYDSAKKCLNELVNISWLSVYRETLEDEYREQNLRRTSSEKNPVDRRIDDLTKRLTSYQLDLQSLINSISDNFRKEVVTSMLYREQFDTYGPLSESKIDLEVVKDGLVHTYADLKALDRTTSKQIGEHISAIKRSIDAIRAWEKDSSTNITVNDIFPLALLRRTQHIVELSNTAEVNKENILKPIKDYYNILKDFIEDKTFDLTPNPAGEMFVEKANTTLTLEQLSSGEKQLFILLTEALLQRNQPFIFIADEPELSLHIKWQRKLLSQIQYLNSNSQIIVATHSPEIAGKWRRNMFNMRNIIHEL